MGTQESRSFQSFFHIQSFKGWSCCIHVATQPIQTHSNRPSGGSGDSGQGLLLPGMHPSQKQGAAWGPYHGPEALHPADTDTRKSCYPPAQLSGETSLWSADTVATKGQGPASRCRARG